jgi:hypothetical protein
MKELECEFFIYDMLVKEKLYKKNIKFKRVIFVPYTSGTLCMEYNCPHRINLQKKVDGVDIYGIDSENPVCKVCDSILYNIAISHSRQRLYYIPDYVA